MIKFKYKIGYEVEETTNDEENKENTEDEGTSTEENQDLETLVPESNQEPEVGEGNE